MVTIIHEQIHLVGRWSRASTFYYIKYRLIYIQFHEEQSTITIG